MKKYDPQKIENKWQKYWEAKKFYIADDKSEKPKYYQLETFPYPSAAGLHVGHPKGYIAEDIMARFNRMNGREVLYTMGWDAFGLPTENYAIKVGKSPKEVAEANIKNFKRQIKMFGLSYDWTREIDTSSPEYYKWTQWIFLQLFKAGKAYQKLAKVNWCSSCQTVLANEQVVDGKCERCGSETIQKEMKQWFFKITDYTERLLADLQGLDWPEATVKRQEDWIGKSEGSKIRFDLIDIPGQENGKHFVEVFTTRADTLFGATFLVISPELAKKWLDVGWQAEERVRKYVEESLSKKELDRLEGAGEKTGVDTGIKAVNPINNEIIPVWTADFVLGHYGTGAVFADAHDERDFEFAKKFSIPLKTTLRPIAKGDDSKIRNLDECFTGDGILYNSGKFDGMTSEKARIEIIRELEKTGMARKEINYKLRDWSVSRQRYWGAPIPMIYCGKCGTVPVSEDDLPVKLPDLKDYRPKGIPPLASSEKFLKVKCPNCNSEAKRESETLDTFVDSSWYYLRYTDSHNNKAFADKEKLIHWTPVDLYVIGAEHTVLHLLYSRFITKFLHDEGYLNFQEPFLKLRHLGLIRGSDGHKMSKSRGNVVNPDEVVEEYGSDAMRLYEMFMGPFEDGQPWDTKGLVGMARFMNRIWNFVNQGRTFLKIQGSTFGSDGGEPASKTMVNRATKKIGEDILGFKFNTAVSELMKFLNHLEESQVDLGIVETYLKLLAPFAPHLAEEIWMEVLGHKESIHLEKWPEYDEKYLQEGTVDLVVQINGKTRDVLKTARNMGEEEVKAMSLASEKVKRHLEGKEVRKVVFISNRLINLIL